MRPRAPTDLAHRAVACRRPLVTTLIPFAREAVIAMKQLGFIAIDRFLMHIQVDYPDAKSEAEIMRLVRSEETAAASKVKSNEKLAQDAVFTARKEISAVTVSSAIEDYIVALVMATHYPDKLDKDVAKWIQVGISPRGVIGLDKVSRAHAWLKGRDFVTPDDVQATVHDVFRHRLVLSYEAHAGGTRANQVIDRIVQQVAVA